MTDEPPPMPPNGSQLNLGVGQYRLSIYGRDLILVVLLLAGFSLMIWDRRIDWDGEQRRDGIQLDHLGAIQRTNQAIREEQRLTNHLINRLLPPDQRIHLPDPDWLDNYIEERERRRKAAPQR